MTIRDYLKKRTRLITGVAFCGWVLLPISAIVSGRGHPPVPLFVAGVVVFGGALLVLLFRVRCPKCQTPFRQLAGEIAFQWGTRRRVNFCPYCGVSMDEPYEAPRDVR
jgi:hypothetical protein